MSAISTEMQGALDLAQLNQSQAKTKVNTSRVYSDQEAREASEQFESMFLAQMLQHMSAGIKTDGPFGGGHSEGIYRSLLNEQYAEQMSKGSGIGIADAIYREMIKLQEV